MLDVWPRIDAATLCLISTALEHKSYDLRETSLTRET